MAVLLETRTAGRLRQTLTLPAMRARILTMAKEAPRHGGARIHDPATVHYMAWE